MKRVGDLCAVGAGVSFAGITSLPGATRLTIVEAFDSIEAATGSSPSAPKAARASWDRLAELVAELG